uniref:non-specific serine/threonine protein kinase n=2 Tax=Hanusia phi TaxID=3032 RepID=A0A7S0HQ13_9CRYP|mmetsp:Transcript_28330/g.64188  ORF Transcript_28330/g.64188 Transcript_28330/m.64188 type:complete len:965 (+) Transcript_28330:178-3072(+)
MGKLEEYEVMKLLGKGSFGSVYCVRRLADRSLHVMKKISIHNMPAKERTATEQEVKVLQRLRHPGIVCYEDSFIHKNRQLCIVMTYCEGGDLATVIEKRRMRAFPENEVVSWFLQIALALQYMHEEHILHRDLKTQNIFLTRNNIIKLGDFGIAKVLEGTLEMAKTVIGTPYYMSPELFRNQPYSFKSDIWSLGCVLYEIVSLRHAFEARDMNSLVQKILRASYGPIPATVSKELRSLLKSMLSLSPQSRPSVNEILALPFIRKEMGAYVQYQLGDDSAANLLRDDPKLMGFIQQEQNRLEQQARKLGFDIKKKSHGSNSGEVELNDGNKPIPPQPDQKAEQMLAQKPTPNSLPSAADADRIRIEEKEKDRVKRAQAFLERELRAKERAEAALRQLQKEKQDRIKALQEQRELRAKRMQQVHPKGEAGLMNEWQHRLQEAQKKHEQRRKELGMVPGDHRPKPPSKSRLEEQHKRSVLEQRNMNAREREGAPIRRVEDKNQVFEDKENFKNVVEKPSSQHSVRDSSSLGVFHADESDGVVQEQVVNSNQQRMKEQAEMEQQRLDAMKQKRAENEKLRDEMNRDMQIMEMKLKQLKAKKDADERMKREKLAQARQKQESNPAQPVEQQAAPKEPQVPRVHNVREARVEYPLSSRSSAQVEEAIQTPAPSHAANLPAPKGIVPAPVPDVQQAEKGSDFRRDKHQDIRNRPQQPVRYVDSRAPQAGEHKGGYRFMVEKPPPVQVDAVRYSEPHFTPPLFAPPPHPPPNRLQVLPTPVNGVYGSNADFFGADGIGADLISRQKELDRLHARQLVAQQTQQEMQEFQMTVHRISKAIGSSAVSRPMMIQAEVGAKISERDRLLRQRQQSDARRIRKAVGQEPSVRLFGDVAYEGGLYSPQRGKAYAQNTDEGIEEEIEEYGHAAPSRYSPNEEIDEQLLYYDEEEANLEQEVAHRTLKIQMLKTALIKDE